MSCNGARPKEKSGAIVKNSSNSESQYIEDGSNKFNRRLSLRLYDVLDRVGASLEFRILRQDSSISREIIATILNQILELKITETYIFGSSSEGTTIPSFNSDVDVLACHGIPVVENIREAGDGNSLLMIRQTHTQPGYVKLQGVYNGQPQTVYSQDIDHEMEEHDSEGRICLKHVSTACLNDAIDERNGPADTSSLHNVDHVIGYRCLKIPEFATEWISRHRQYEWPSKRMLDKMKTMGCFAVGVGHPASEENNLEWRLSFSLQERELMFTMNMVQHKCYVILI